VSVRISLAFRNSQSSTDVMPVSTAASVTNQSLSELEVDKICRGHESMNAGRVEFKGRTHPAGILNFRRSSKEVYSTSIKLHVNTLPNCKKSTAK
jgi:hypothetical protein